MKYNATTDTSEFMGAQTFEIHVLSRENRSYCQEGKLIVLANFLVMVNATRLNSTERLELYQAFTSTFYLSQTSVVLFEEQPEIKNISTGSCKVTSENKMSSWNPTDPILGISWMIGCNLNNTWNNSVDTIFNISSKLGGTLGGFPLLGWRILNGIDGGKCSPYFPNTHTSSILSFIYLSATSSSLVEETSSLSLLRLTEAPRVSTLVVSSLLHQKLLSSAASTSLIKETSSLSSVRFTEIPFVSTSDVSSLLHPKLLSSAASTLFVKETSLLPSVRFTEIPFLSTSDVSSLLHQKLLSSAASTSLVKETSLSTSFRLTEAPHISTSVVSSLLHTELSPLPSESSGMPERSATKR